VHRVRDGEGPQQVRGRARADRTAAVDAPRRCVDGLGSRPRPRLLATSDRNGRGIGQGAVLQYRQYCSICIHSSCSMPTAVRLESPPTHRRLRGGRACAEPLAGTSGRAGALLCHTGPHSCGPVRRSLPYARGQGHWAGRIPSRRGHYAVTRALDMVPARAGKIIRVLGFCSRQLETCFLLWPQCPPTPVDKLFALSFLGTPVPSPGAMC
jgi:hypothetical protein